MTVLRAALVAVQAVTFIGLGIVLYAAGQWRLGLAQLLLAGVTVVVYL